MTRKLFVREWLCFLELFAVGNGLALVDEMSSGEKGIQCLAEENNIFLDNCE